MSELSTFAAHARLMAEAEHKPECKGFAVGPPRWVDHDWSRPPCPGCVSDADRALWARLADEADAYLSHDEDEVLL